MRPADGERKPEAVSWLRFYSTEVESLLEGSTAADLAAGDFMGAEPFTVVADAGKKPVSLTRIL